MDLMQVIQGRDKEEAVFEQEGVIRYIFGLYKYVGGDLSFFCSHGREQVQAALHKIRTVKGGVIGQGLQAEVAQPQTAVSLGAVLKYILHAVSQGLHAHIIDLLQFRILQPQGLEGTVVSGGFRCYDRIGKNSLPLGRGIHHFQLNVAEAVASGQLQISGKLIQMDKFLLDPGSGKPAFIITGFRLDLFRHFREFQTQVQGRVHGGTCLVDVDLKGTDHMVTEIQDQRIIPFTSIFRKSVNLFFAVREAPPAQPGGVFNDINDPDGSVFCFFNDRPVGFRLGQQLFIVFELKAVIDLKCECHCIFLP